VWTVGTVGWSAGGVFVGGRGIVMTGWGKLGGEEGGEGFRRSSWEREQWIVDRKRSKSEGDNNRDKKIEMVKVIIQKKKAPGTGTTKSSDF
jgi:hypothetical protein